MNQVSEKSFGALTRSPLTWARRLSATTTRSVRAFSTCPGKALCNAPEGERRQGAMRGGAWFRVGMLAAIACLFTFVQAASVHAQEHKNKLPIVGKISGNSDRQAYSGTVQSLNMKQRILSVNSRQGRDTEIFPVKKNIRVEAINGKKMDLKALTPGTSVLIYFDQRGGKRTIKNIIVLETSKGQAKHAPAS